MMNLLKKWLDAGRVLMFGSALALAGSGAGCTTNPATGQSQFNVLSTSQEVTLGQEATPDFIKEYGGEIPSPAIRSYVSDIGYRLVAVSERPDLPWEFYVVDSAVLNAFALPGGKVFVSRGMLAKLNSEAQLAGVLAHEVGHVTAQHIGQQMSQAILIQGVATGVGIAAQTSEEDWLRVLGVGAQVAGPVYLLSYGRNQELQADELGMRYMSRLGYQPAAMREVMQVLAAEDGGPGGPEFLSTHPYPDSRVKQIDELLRSRYAGAAEQGKYGENRTRYQQEVLSRLQDLPPAQHNPEQ